MYKILPIVGYIPENQHGYPKWWFGNSPLQYVSRHINFQELFCPTKGVGGKCYDQWVMQRRRWFGKGDSFKIQKSLLDFWGAPYKLRPFSLPYCFHRISSEGTRKKLWRFLENRGRPSRRLFHVTNSGSSKVPCCLVCVCVWKWQWVSLVVRVSWWG